MASVLIYFSNKYVMCFIHTHHNKNNNNISNLIITLYIATYMKMFLLMYKSTFHQQKITPKRGNLTSEKLPESLNLPNLSYFQIAILTLTFNEILIKILQGLLYTIHHSFKRDRPLLLLALFGMFVAGKFQG